MKTFHEQLMDYTKSVGLHLSGESSMVILGTIASPKDSTYNKRFKLLNVNYKTNHNLINHHMCSAFLDKDAIDLVAYNHYSFHPIQFLTSYSIPYSDIKAWKVSSTEDIDVLFKSGCMTILEDGLPFVVDFVKHVNANNEYKGSFDEFNRKLQKLNTNN